MKFENFKSLHNTLVRPRGGTEYLNEGKLGGEDFTFNTQIDIRDFRYTNRVAEVVTIPPGDYPYEVGDELLVHHNVFRIMWSQQCRLRRTNNYIEGELYEVSEEEAFAYRKPGGEWVQLKDYVLVEPSKEDDGAPSTVWGVAVTGNRKGEKVMFTPKSNYEFRVDDKLYYKMSERHICGQVL